MSDCLFCKMVNKQINANIVFEDNDVLAFKDINPQAPVHVLVIPKKHIESIDKINNEDNELLGKILLTIQNLTREFKIDKSGYRVVINTNAQAGQSVFHIHYHLLGGRVMTWPPG